MLVTLSNSCPSSLTGSKLLSSTAESLLHFLLHSRRSIQSAENFCPILRFILWFYAIKHMRILKIKANNFYLHNFITRHFDPIVLVVFGLSETIEDSKLRPEISQNIQYSQAKYSVTETPHW